MAIAAPSTPNSRLAPAHVDRPPLPWAPELTFVFTDMERSTQLLERLGGRYGDVLVRHAELVRESLALHDGHEVDTEGVAFIFVFTEPTDALACCAELQRRLALETWPQDAHVRLRIGVHTGSADLRRIGYVGMDVHAGARVAAAGHGGQVLVSATTAAAVKGRLPPDLSLASLGTFRLKDLREPLGLLQLAAPGLASAFPPLRTLDAPEEPPAPGEPPYLGLAHFEETDAARYFGREALVEALLARLSAEPFLAVVGASGSGKSSLVRAGLVPALRRRLVEVDRDPAAIALLTPTEDPRAALEAALGGLPGAPAAVVVDQFEELFTLVREEAVREAFVERLLEIMDAGVALVVTMRADFYDRLAGHDRLRTLAAAHQAYLGPLTVDELRRAIEGPALQGGWRFDPGLVELILHDVGDEPGALPLLSHAIRETWGRRMGTLMTLRGYLDAGGVQGAIARTAGETIGGLAADEVPLARDILLRLTELGEDAPDTRRRASLDELVAGQRDPIAARAILDRLVAARLVVLEGSEAVIAHEALIREWPTLREWLEDDREGLRLGRMLTLAARDWEGSGRDPSLLLRGARLARAREWLAGPVSATALEAAFVGASLAAEQAEADEREAVRQREFEAARALAASEAGAAARLRRRAVLLAGLLVVAVLLAGFSFLQLKRAEDQTHAAEEQRSLAEEQRGVADSRGLAEAATAQLETDPELSVLLALEALDAAPTQEADRALRRATQASHVRRLVPASALGVPLDLGANGTRLLLGDDAGVISLVDLGDAELAVTTLGTVPSALRGALATEGLVTATTTVGDVAIWDGSNDGPVTLATGFPRAVGLAVDRSGARVAVGGSIADDPGPNLQVWDVATRTLVRAIRSGDFPLTAVALSPDGELVAAGGWDRTIRIWRVATGELVSTLRGNLSLIVSVAFDAGGDLLVSGGYDPIVRVWNVRSGDAVAELRGHTAPVNSVAFDPPGRRVISASEDGTARLWDALRGDELAVLRGTLGGIAQARFGPGDSDVSTVGWDGAVRIWGTAGDRPLATASGHANEVWAVDLDAAGDRFVTASIDHTARVWDALDGRPISTFRGHATEVSTAALSPVGTQAVSGDMEGTVWLWDATSGREQRRLAEGLGGVRRVDYSPDGARVAAAGDSGVRVWDVASGDELVAVEGPSGVVDFDPSGERMVVSTQDSAAILDSHSGETIARVAGAHDATVLDARFDPAGTRVATAGADGTARIWDVASGAALLVLRARENAGAVNSASFSSDGRRLVTGNDDGTLDVWDTASGELLISLRADAAQVRSAEFTPDGHRIVAAATSEAVARVLGCDLCGSTEEVMALARDRLTRTLTSDERALYLHEPVEASAPPEMAQPSTAARVMPPSPVPVESIAPVPSPTAEPVPVPSASVEPSLDPLGAALCAGRRTSCDLSAGRYHAASFRPPLSFAVGEGWLNAYATPRWIELAALDGGLGLNLLSDPTDLMLGGRVVPIEPGPDGLLAAVRRPYGLTVTDPAPTSVGGFEGIGFDVINGLDRDVELIQQDEGVYFLGPGQHDRWVIVDVDGTTVAVLQTVVDPTSFDERQPELQAVVDSVAFDSRTTAP